LNDWKIKRNARIFTLVLVVLLLIAYIFELRGDYLKYLATAHSAPFYVFAIRRIISIVIGVFVVFTMYISIKKDNKNRKED